MVALHCRLAALLLLVLAACSAADNGPVRSVRPGLEWDDPAPPPRPDRTVYRFELREDAATWGNLFATSQELAKGEGWAVGVWRGGGRLALELPADLPAFDSVVVRGTFRAGHGLDLRLTGGGFSESWVHNLPGEPDSEPQDVVLSCRAPDPTGPRPEQLLLIVGGPDCTLESVAFSIRGLQASLPEPDQGRSVELADEERVAVGLTPQRAMAAEFVSEPGDALEFSYGRWPESQAPVAQLKLQVTVTSDIGQIQNVYPLKEGSGWSDTRIALDALQAGPTSAQRVRFELIGDEAADAACALADLWVGRRSRRAPTVLLITSDTHRGDHLGAAGQGVAVATPVLDALAERGVFFEDCFSAINNTIPSHASLFTGLSPRQTGLLTNFERLASEAQTLGDVFRAGGFMSFGVYSASHLGAAEGNVAQGFDRLAPAGGGGNAEDAVTRVLGWMSAAEGRPLFVWVHLFDTHQPYGPPGSEGSADRDPAALYRAEVDYVDAQLGALLGHPRLGSAVVAFTADHGETLAKPGASFDHTLLLPSTLHIPLILTWPDAPRGTRVAAPVSLVDLGRTLLDLGGLGASPFPGENLLANLDSSPETAPARFALGDMGTFAAVTSRDDFLVIQLSERGRGGMDLARHQSALYDRRADPACLEDLSEVKADLARTLRAQLIDWLNEPVGESLGSASDLSPERLEALRALGYTGDDEVEPTGEWIAPDCPCPYCTAGRE